MTSLITSGRKLSGKICRKCRPRRLWVGFLENGLSEDHEILNVIGDNLAYKCVRNNVTSCVQSAAKRNWILHKSEQNEPSWQSRIIRLWFTQDHPWMAQNVCRYLPFEWRVVLFSIANWWASWLYIWNFKSTNDFYGSKSGALVTSGIK